jgi:hypothetical protein
MRKVIAIVFAFTALAAPAAAEASPLSCAKAKQFTGHANAKCFRVHEHQVNLYWSHRPQCSEPVYAFHPLPWSGHWMYAEHRCHTPGGPQGPTPVKK